MIRWTGCNIIAVLGIPSVVSMAFFFMPVVFEFCIFKAIKENIMRYISKKDILKIDRSLILDSISHAYELFLDENYTMPDRIHVQDGDNTLLLMPCFESNYFATKLVSVFPDAPKHGAPAVNGIMTLADSKTGMPLAIMDGAALTAERTGAVGGLAVKILNPPRDRNRRRDRGRCPGLDPGPVSAAYPVK